jgi:ketosteroid isomerase-like protein
MADRISTQQFEALMERLARAWSEQDTEAGVACFTEDALYREPPDIQLYIGHDQLRPYFAALTPGTYMRFHHLWFNEATQGGAGEYSFGSEGDRVVDHGVAVVEIRDGRIASWREYQRKGTPDFEAFISPEGKTWQWTIANYP